MVIRQIEKEDSSKFVTLAKQLGYDADEEYVEDCISINNANEIVFVASDDDNIVGWIDSKIHETYLIKPVCEIVGLVVDEKQRGKGIGSALVKRVEEWALELGMKIIRVRTNIIREEAQKFYLKNGYLEKKQSKLFIKAL